MLYVKLICIGKIKEKFYESAALEYQKRLSPYCRVEICELPETKLPQHPGKSEIETALKKEASLIFKNIPSECIIVAMCIEGTMLSSVKFSKLIEDTAVNGYSKMCFIIGGSYGLHQSVKDISTYRLSVSPMTFPHHLFRVILLEQIYRCFKISEGSEYHK